MKSIPIKIAIWFILFMALLTLGLNMVSEPNTIENVIGFFIIVATVALTPAVLEQMWIEKWDGHLPQYGAVPTLFKDITK